MENSGHRISPMCLLAARSSPENINKVNGLIALVAETEGFEPMA
jgi:hypothetical protein